MSLPRGFQTTLDTIPARIPYLRAEPDLVARWAERIGSDGFRIGICWRGNALLNPQRSIPLASFAPLAAIEGVRLVGLQKEQEPLEVEANGASLRGRKPRRGFRSPVPIRSSTVPRSWPRSISS